MAIRDKGLARIYVACGVAAPFKCPVAGFIVGFATTTRIKKAIAPYNRKLLQNIPITDKKAEFREVAAVNIGLGRVFIYVVMRRIQPRQLQLAWELNSNIKGLNAGETSILNGDF